MNKWNPHRRSLRGLTGPLQVMHLAELSSCDHSVTLLSSWDTELKKKDMTSNKQAPNMSQGKNIDLSKDGKTQESRLAEPGAGL